MRDSGRLASGVTANDVGDQVPDPLDSGLSVCDWAEFDPDTYRAAVRESLTGDELVEVLFELAEGGSVEGHRADVRERLQKRLAGEVQRKAEWIERWEGKFEQDGSDER